MKNEISTYHKLSNLDSLCVVSQLTLTEDLVCGKYLLSPSHLIFKTITIPILKVKKLKLNMF